MFRVPNTLVYIYHHPPLKILSPTRMLIVVDVLTPKAPYSGTVFSREQPYILVFQKVAYTLSF